MEGDHRPPSELGSTWGWELDSKGLFRGFTCISSDQGWGDGQCSMLAAQGEGPELRPTAHTKGWKGIAHVHWGAEAGGSPWLPGQPLGVTGKF